MLLCAAASEQLAVCFVRTDISCMPAQLSLLRIAHTQKSEQSAIAHSSQGVQSSCMLPAEICRIP